MRELGDLFLVAIGILGGLWVQQQAETVLSAAPLWVSIPVSIGGVGGFGLLFLILAKRIMERGGYADAGSADGDDDDRPAAAH